MSMGRVLVDGGLHLIGDDLSVQVLSFSSDQSSRKEGD